MVKISALELVHRRAHVRDAAEGGEASPSEEVVCSLVERTSRDTGARHLLVAKRYRNVKHRSFRNDAMYRHRTGRSHADKAIRSRTDLGLEIQEHVRAEREFDVLCALWSGGVPVPYPAWRFGTELLVELIGDGDVAAPRLVAARLDGAAARRALDDVLGACADMLALGWVHGDLSPHNVLWHEERAVLIDFPSRWTSARTRWRSTSCTATSSRCARGLAVGAPTSPTRTRRSRRSCRRSSADPRSAPAGWSLGSAPWRS
jgi:serine/threonine-protein kinase RIO1